MATTHTSQRSGVHPQLGRRLFDYAIVGDTHVNHEEGVSTSPYACNQLADGRWRHVVADVKRRAPAFVVHLGDAVNPVPHLGTFPQAIARFKHMARDLDCPLYLTPGNHDIGDKCVDWMPAGHITRESLAQYRASLGQDYYAFDAHGLHFLVVNSPLIGSGLPEEQEQRDWLAADLAANRGKRMFLFTHYPLYICDPDEISSYDNIEGPGRAWLLELVTRHGVEAVYSGHVHNFFYDRQGPTEFHILPSVSFVRHDYSELFRVASSDNEHGRNDRPKFAYLLVRVYERGTVNHVIRTYGRTLAPDLALTTPLPVREPLHALEYPHAPVGVHLRKPWAAPQEIPASGAVDEFERKRARNDYVLMGLWETGIRHLRVPLHEFADPQTAPRLAKLQALGHVFTAYHCGIPEGRQREVLRRHHGLIHMLELVLKWDRPQAWLPALLALKREAPVRITLSRLRGFGEQATGHQFMHFINYGIPIAEAPACEALLAIPGMRDAVDGLAFTLAVDASPMDDIPRIAAFARQHDLQASVLVRFAGRNPAEAFTDELANAARVMETVATGMACRSVDVFLDGFEDTDRSYFARHGLYDRLYNPRLAAHVFRHTATWFSGLGELKSITRAGGAIRFEGRERTLWLGIPPPDGHAEKHAVRINLADGCASGADQPAAAPPPLCLTVEA